MGRTIAAPAFCGGFFIVCAEGFPLYFHFAGRTAFAGKLF